MKMKMKQTRTTTLLSLSLTVFLVGVTTGVIGASSSSKGAFQGMCPEPVCDCFLDPMGRMEVSCMHGHMHEIPHTKVNPGTEVIRIVAPVDYPNYLTIGGFFRSFKRLEELHIVGSNIPNIGENSFWGVQSLRVLNLTRNNISIIVDTNFKGLVNVENLSLAENSIESFVSASFQHLGKLKSLDLSNNRVNKLVERLFFNLHMLENLDLSGNWIKELNPDVFRDIWKLKVLRCRRCGLKNINPMFYALLPDLRILDLSHNEFKYLNRDEFGSLQKLEELYLDGNGISAVTDETFRSLRLRTLSLASNRIVRIDRYAFYNSTIQRLNLSDNKFETLDRITFSEIKKTPLVELDLSNNPRLKHSPLLIILAENPQLERLSLANNKFEDMPLDFFEFQSELVSLNLSGNQLKELFPHQLTHLYKLEVLDLSHNKFRGMSPLVLNVLQRMKGIRMIRLEGNPWQCDLCQIEALLKWVQTAEYFKNGCSDPYGPHCLRCLGPPQLADKSLITLEESQLEWCTHGAEPTISILPDDPRLGLFVGCGFIVVFLIIASLGIVVRTRWHAAHYYTHESDRPETQTPPVPPGISTLGEDSKDAMMNHPRSNGRGSNGGGFDNLYYNNGNYKSNKYNKMIATIEEIHYVDAPYDPPGGGDLLEENNHHHHHYNNHVHHHNTSNHHNHPHINNGEGGNNDDTNIMLPPPSSYR